MTFFSNWFSDLLLIPCALPPLLQLHRWLNLRDSDKTPTVYEILAHLAGAAILFEWIGPKLMSRSVGDPWDVVAYAMGAVIACAWWNRDRFRFRVAAR